MKQIFIIFCFYRLKFVSNRWVTKQTGIRPYGNTRPRDELAQLVIGVRGRMVIKMKKNIVLIIISILLLLSACQSSNSKAEETGARAYTDFIGSDMIVGVNSGDVFRDVARDFFGFTKIEEFPTVPDLVAALDSNRIDGFLVASGYLNQLKESDIAKGLEYYFLPSDVYLNEAASIFHTTELRDSYNEWFRGFKESGEWEKNCDFWMGGALPSYEDIPKYNLTGENGTLHMADTGNYPPLSYISENGEHVGYNVDMMSRFAEYMGMKLEISLMNYNGIMPNVISGKSDASSCSFTVTDERNDAVIFGEPSVITQGVLIVKGNQTSTLTPENFVGKRFSILLGSIFDKIADTKFEPSEKLYFQTILDELIAVDLGKTDCALMDEVLAGTQLKSDEFKNLTTIPIDDDALNFQFGMFSMKQDVIDELNVFLREIKASGIFNEIKTRWVDNFDPDTPMPTFNLTGENGTLKFGVNASFPPFVFAGDGNEHEWKGFDIEIAMRFAEWAGYDLEIIDMDFSALVPYIISEKADLGSTMYITEERKKSVLFIEPSIECPSVIITRKDTVISDASSFNFIEWVKSGIQKNLITENRWVMVFDGLLVTLEISLLAQIFGTVMGAIICYLATRKGKVPRTFAGIYSWLIRGTPMVVLLMIAYYIIFGKSDISAVLIAVAAFTLVEGAKIGGNLKSSISTISLVEIEAARSLGYSATGAFFRVTLPQAIKISLPTYLNGFVELVKSTAIVGYIAIQDLTRAGDIIRSRTYDPYFPLLFVAILYLLMTTICIQLFKLIIKKIQKQTS